MKLISAVRSLMLALALALCFASSSSAQINLSITIGPPPLPVYEQPVCPDEDYMWTPGYWAWGDGDYYWVPGTWLLAPEPGFLWTPGYWGWRDGAYIFHEGYWGPRVGFYGGINYGFGYGGRGYEGGRWDNGHFFYNRSVNNVNQTIVKNVYNTTVVNNTTINRVSYNGGNGGVEARATAEETAAERDRHIPPLAVQTQHAEAARTNPQLHVSANQGRPPIAATQRPNEFRGTAAVAAKEAGATHPAAAHPGSIGAAAPTPIHARDIPPAMHAAAPNMGNPALDKTYQEQQQIMHARQDQEKQKLQAQQEADHQRMTQQQANDARRKQMEQDHQRQTQQLMERHAQEQQQLTQRHAQGQQRVEAAHQRPHSAGREPAP